MIEFNCSACGKGLWVEDYAAGEERECPSCGRLFVAPASSKTKQNASDNSSRARTVLGASFGCLGGGAIGVVFVILLNNLLGINFQSSVQFGETFVVFLVIFVGFLVVPPVIFGTIIGA